MLSDDGASIQVESVSDGVLRLRYVAGAEGSCDACVLDPDDLEALIGEALVGKVDDVSSVEVIR
jgi:Fe-S cluster biogenesis protein NfuA